MGDGTGSLLLTRCQHLLSGQHCGGEQTYGKPRAVPGQLIHGQKARSLDASSTQLLAKLERAVVRYTDTISARMPDAIELRSFRTAGLVPVIVVSRTAYDERGPLRLTRYIYPANQVLLLHHKAAR